MRSLFAVVFSIAGVICSIRACASESADSILAYIKKNLEHGYIVSYHQVSIDSVDLYLVINFLVNEQTMWESSVKQRGKLYEVVWDGGGFQIDKYIQRNPGDWVVCTLFLDKGDTVKLWKAEFAFYYGDSAVSSVEYVTAESRWQFKLYLDSDIITIPSDEITRGTESHAPALWLRFKKGTFKRKGEIWFGNFRIDPPESIVVRNWWVDK